MVNKFKLTMRHRSFCTPNPDADLCMRVDLKLDKKTVENQDQYWAAGREPRAASRWAFGPLGRRAVGRWAAGLLLAKPLSNHLLLLEMPSCCTSSIAVSIISTDSAIVTTSLVWCSISRRKIRSSSSSSKV